MSALKDGQEAGDGWGHFRIEKVFVPTVITENLLKVGHTCKHHQILRFSIGSMRACLFKKA